MFWGGAGGRTGTALDSKAAREEGQDLGRAPGPLETPLRGKRAVPQMDTHGKLAAATQAGMRGQTQAEAPDSRPCSVPVEGKGPLSGDAETTRFTATEQAASQSFWCAHRRNGAIQRWQRY